MTAEKVEIVRRNVETYGLNVTLDAIGLPKSTWYYWKDQKVDYETRYAHLREPLIEVLRENPAYGYRKIMPDLDELGYLVGEWTLRRVLKMWDLSLRRWAGKPKPSVPREILAKEGHGMNLVARMGKPSPLEVFYTDFTEIWYAKRSKKAYLMALVDDAMKWSIGWAVGPRPNTDLALEALSMAAETLDDVGLSLKGRIIHHDRDTVYTGYRWLRAVLITHRARISFSENGAKGNTSMESFNGHFKGENKSLFHDAANVWELERIIDQQMISYNGRRRHATLGYTAPIDYIIQEEILPQPAVGLAALRT